MILVATYLTLCLAMFVCYFIHSDSPTVATLFFISIPVCAYPLLQNYVQQTSEGDNQMGRLALSRLLPYLLYVPIAYVLYLQFGATPTRMILLQWGIYSMVFIAIIISTKPVFKKIKPIWKSLKEENSQYGIQLYIGSLVMVTTNYLAGITLGYFNTDNCEVGFYTLALTVTSPLTALPTIVGTTYFKKFTQQPFIPAKIIWSTTLLTTLTCILFLLIINPIVSFLYSKQYAIVGTYASMLSIGFCIHGLGDMFNRYLCSHGQGVAVRNASIINGLFKIFGYTILVALFNTNGAIATTIICDIVYFLCLIYYYSKFIKTPKNG